MNHSFVLALSTLVGTIIGAGIFAIPYVMAASGILSAAFYFVLLGGTVLLLHLCFGEVALRTHKKARLIGYAEQYLGKGGKYLATFSTVFGIVGALLAYTIIGGDFLRILLGPVVQLSEPVFSVMFWGFLSLFIFRGIQLIAKAEFLMTIALFASILVIFFFAAPHVELSNIPVLDRAFIFLPYGVILFALAGWSAIPEIADFFKGRKEKGSLDNVIVAASGITIVLYAVFALVVTGVSGRATSPDALQGLAPFLGKEIILLGAFFGLVAIAASFLVLGNYLKNSLRYDFRVPYISAASIATFVPIALFLLGLREFIFVLGIVGIVMGVVEGVLILLLWRQARLKGDRIPEYSLRIPGKILVLLAVLLVGGALAELLSTYG